MRIAGRVLLAVVGVALGTVAVIALKEATLSTHRKVTEASHTVVVLRAQVHGQEHRQTLHETVEAVLVACRLEVSSDLEADPEPLGQDVFRASLAPALDESNQRQLRGCLEDWTLDHLKVDVLDVRSEA
jgi:hypothetical protein